MLLVLPALEYTVRYSMPYFGSASLEATSRKLCSTRR